MLLTPRITPDGSGAEQSSGLALSVTTAFQAVVKRTPHKTALICEDHQLSYLCLSQQVDALAARLQSRNVGPGDFVGLFAQRGIEAIVAVLAVLRTGAVYVPFDASYPRNALCHIYKDSQPTLMLVQPGLPEATGLAPFWQGEPLYLDGTGSSETVLPVAVSPEHPAYVMYTSGSTGRPKGVVVPQRAILRLVQGNHFARLDADEVILQLAPLAFDASTFEIWGALLNGGTLVVLPKAQPTLDDIADSICGQGITTLWLTAGLFHLMVDHRLESLRPLRQLLAGGDVLSPAHIVKVLQQLPDCQLINGYGPTENTTFTCCYTFPRDFSAESSAPVGQAIGGTTVYILDEQGQPVGEGEEGELYAGGHGVALGYLNQPALTQARFVADPFSANSKARLYRTGDRVRRLPDGNIEFRGRVDRQIKLNGKRIELDEIEHCLRRHPRIEDAAVVVQEVKQEMAPPVRHLLAFIVPVKALSAAPLFIKNAGDFLRQELPDYMVPSGITTLEAFPLTPNGKVDRAALVSKPEPLPHPVLPSEPAALDTEARLQVLFRQVLVREHIGLHDNFFDLGGNSLRLIELQALIRSEMGVTIDLIELFRLPSVSALALNIKQKTPHSPPAQSRSKIRSDGRKAALERARKQRKK
ncbi:MAG: amino acid adenylation domain-containing protein [Pontibacterium sp.]